MIVKRSDFSSVIDRLSVPGLYGLDTETTGLQSKDTLFSVILADAHQGYYFNFNERADHLGNFAPEEYRLPRTWLPQLAPIIENTESTFFIHNAKFDLWMLSKEELEVLGIVHCTEAFERVVKNNILGHKPYSLASCAKRRGLAKDARVEEYIKTHKLITKIKIPGKEKAEERWHFELVPFGLMSEYGETDAILHRKIGLSQIQQLRQLDADAPTTAPKIAPLVINERQLTKTCFRMERTGIKINRPYVREALSYTLDEAGKARIEFGKMTGIEYQDSASVFKTVFEKHGIELPLTKTGKPSTAKAVLDELENPIADQIRKVRGLEKLASTYYSSFLYYADDLDQIHANMRQGGTETSRFSYSNPNLQNLPKEDEPEDRLKPYLVRRSFTPISDAFDFFAIDFEQQEFRLLLDYAGEKAMIDAVMAGLDVHDATAQMMGTTRKKAKTLNFGLLYGMGVLKLARALGVTVEEAYALRALYFEKLPKVRALIRSVMNTGEKRGYIWNWYGFRNHLSSPEYAYVLPNHLIQGSGAQVIRVAMTQLDEYIRTHRLRTQMLIQVHDELLFQCHREEIEHVAEFKKIMQGVYKPRNGLYLTCAVERSKKSFAKFDMEKFAA